MSRSRSGKHLPLSSVGRSGDDLEVLCLRLWYSKAQLLLVTSAVGIMDNSFSEGTWTRRYECPCCSSVLFVGRLLFLIDTVMRLQRTRLGASSSMHVAFWVLSPEWGLLSVGVATFPNIFHPSKQFAAAAH